MLGRRGYVSEQESLVKHLGPALRFHMHVPELCAENSCTGLTLPVSRAAHNAVTPGEEAGAGFPVVSQEKEPEME